MQITEKQKQQLIDLNDSRVNKILDLGLKIGEWYTIKNEYVDWIMCYQGNYSGYGFNTSKSWGVDYAMAADVWEKATKKEITQALADEAKRRGFNEGVKVKLFDSIFSTSVLKREYFTYQEDYNRFGIRGGDEDGNYAVFFKNGVWAEIIDEKAELKEEIKSSC